MDPRGGYVSGTAAQDDPVCREYVRQLGVTVASVDYRLAPEYPYPAALEDCYSALTWLAGLPSIDPARVAIAGGSAGGGLAAALGLTARDRGEVSLAAQILVYPMLDDRTVGDGLDDPRHRLWTQKSNRFGWAAYLGGADPQTAVPARHADLAGLPPTWLGVGTLDLFYAEDLAYAPLGSVPPKYRAAPRWWRAHFTASTCSPRRLLSHERSSPANATHSARHLPAASRIACGKKELLRSAAGPGQRAITGGR